MKSKLQDLKEYAIARIIYAILWLHFKLRIQHRFLVLTQELVERHFVTTKTYHKNTVLFVVRMTKFKDAWNGLCPLIIAIDLNTREELNLNLIPGENCFVLPYNELSRTLYDPNKS